MSATIEDMKNEQGPDKREKDGESFSWNPSFLYSLIAQSGDNPLACHARYRVFEPVHGNMFGNEGGTTRLRLVPFRGMGLFYFNL